MMTAPFASFAISAGAIFSRGSVRRILALARAEILLLRRNPSALLTALVAPLVLIGVQVQNATAPGSDSSGGLGTGDLIVLSLTGFSLLFGVYYNLVITLVARREQLMLKNLRTAELSDGETLVGTVTAAVAVSWAQVILGVVAGVLFLHTGVPTNPVLVLVGILLGTVVFALLAAASTPVAANVELAPLSATPVLMLCMPFSGLMFPLGSLPEPVQRVAEVLPLTPVVELLRLGLGGLTSDGRTVNAAATFPHAALPCLVLAAWIFAGAWAARRWFRWEPRR